MPRYFFHLVHTSSERILDDEGVEAANDAAAILEALKAVRELLDEEAYPTSEWRFQVADEAGRVLVTFDLDNVNLHQSHESEVRRIRCARRFGRSA